MNKFHGSTWVLSPVYLVLEMKIRKEVLNSEALAPSVWVMSVLLMQLAVQ
jgi:hypothetical protein